MSDPRSDPDSPLTPEEDDAVRALLASARHSEPIPPDVVARLDETLSSLTAERRETRAPVVTLASRRRRMAGTLVLAAAAVVVAGVGIGQVLPSGGSDDSGGSAESATSADDQLSTGESDRSFSAEDSSPDAGADEKQGDTDMRSQETAPVPSSSAYAGLSDLDGDAALKPQVRKLRQSANTASFSADPSCPLPSTDAEAVVSVTYDGLPGALIFRAPVGSTQQVDVFLCGETSARRSLRLRVP